MPVVRYHSERSYQYAAAFAKRDIGLSPAGDGRERFEVRGANVVRTMLLDHGMEDDRVVNVWDCIALHASTALARHKSPETRCANRGIALSVRRSGAEALEPELVRGVLDRWLRREFVAQFTAVLADEVRAHPDSTRMSWLEPIAVAEIPGFAPTDFLALIHATEQSSERAARETAASSTIGGAE